MPNEQGSFLNLKDLQYLQRIVNNSVNLVQDVVNNKILDEKTAVQNEFKAIFERVLQMNVKN